jgi:Amt family ammonium transporter
MSLNGALAGLVGITAGCASVDALGSILIGLVAGILVTWAVEFIDFKLHVDDPVGAVAVHGVCGVWGPIAVGLFAKEIFVELEDGTVEVVSDGGGLFYGGGVDLLLTQALGVLCIAAWTFAAMGLTFFIIKKAHGLRVAAEDEIVGLDFSEHGLASSYADFLPVADLTVQSAEGTSGAAAAVPVEEAVTVTDTSTGKKMTKVTIITRPSKFDTLKEALDKIGITGITVSSVMGYGTQFGNMMYRGVPVESKLVPKLQIDVVISKVPVPLMVETVKKSLYTGKIGDGKIFITDVENVIRVRTGEEGFAALQDATPVEK